jgi:hypothetical protein
VSDLKTIRASLFTVEASRPEPQRFGMWMAVWLQMALAQLHLALGDGATALTAARRAAEIAKQSHFRLSKGLRCVSSDRVLER